MALGTAGFTAGLAIVRLEQNGLAPAERHRSSSPGATGGVGSVAVAGLARLGYEVDGDDRQGRCERDYLRQSGRARGAVDGRTLEMGTRPLEKATWAGAVDAVGGDMLAWLTRTTDCWGGIASTGLTGGVEMHTTVMPFILRGVSSSGSTP